MRDTIGIEVYYNCSHPNLQFVLDCSNTNSYRCANSYNCTNL